MIRTSMMIAGLASVSLLSACQTYNPVQTRGGPSAPCTTSEVMRAEVIAINPDFVTAVGPDGEFNVATRYLNEMPRVGDYLRIRPTDVGGNCVYRPG